MQTKLTLRLDEGLIRCAKAFARASGKSVSKIVADYLVTLEKEEQDFQMTPVVRSLKGALRGQDVDGEDYRRYLEDKHL